MTVCMRVLWEKRSFLYSVLAPALLLLLPSQMHSQSAALVLSSQSGAAGSTAALNLSLSNTATGGRPASVLFSVAYNSSEFTNVVVTEGTVAAAASKTVVCSPSPGLVKCLLYGMNNTPMGDGIAAIVNATLSSGSTSMSRAIQITQTQAASPSGTLLVLNATGGSVQVAQQSQAPAVGGPSSLTCTPVTLGAGQSASCTVTLSAAAGSGGVPVALTSSSPLVTVPASVTVPGGIPSASFSARAGSIGADANALLTATSNGSSRSASLSLVGLATVSSLTCAIPSLGSGASTACTVTLSKAAPAGGLVVTLTRSNSLITVPASVTIAAGQTTATFSATVATILADVAAQLTAAANGSSRTASLSLVTSATVSSLTCSPTSVASGASTSCTATLSKAAPAGGLLVTLTRNNSSVTTPASVTIAAGQTTATFTATVAAITADAAAQLTASANGSSRTASLRLVSPVAVSSLACSPTSVASGASTSCTVRLSKAAPAGGFAITASSSSAYLSVPATVTVPAGSISSVFTGTAATVTTNQSVTVTARASSASVPTVSTAVTVQPPASQGTTFSCTPATVTGAGSISCTVTMLTAAPSGGMTVAVTSTHANVVVPSSLTVPAGGRSATFTGNVTAVSAATTVQVRMTLAGATIAASITLQPAAPPAVTVSSLSCSPNSVYGGVASLCTVVLSSAAPAGGALVTLADNSSAATPPGSVTVPAGLTSAGFSVSTSSVTVQQTATLTATRGSSSVTAGLTVRPFVFSFTSFSCFPSGIGPGMSTQCSVALSTAPPTDVAIRLSASKTGFAVPDPVTLRAGQTSLIFIGTASPTILLGPVTLTATLLTQSIQTNVVIQGGLTLKIAVPGTLTSMDGTPVRFDVTTIDPADTPVTLSAANVPPGARFDSATGEFSWETNGAPAGSYPVQFSATNGLGLSSSATVLVEVVSGEPVLEKLTHAATRKEEGACSPGSLATLRGTGLSKDVQLFINGEPAAVIDGNAHELTFQCPDLEPGAALSFQVQREAHSSNFLDSVMADAAPGIFTLDASGSGQGVALLDDTGKVLMLRSPEVLSQPATRLDPVSILVTGLGREVLESPDRVLVQMGPAQVPAESVTAAAPGVWHLVVRVPEEAPLGVAVPLGLALTMPDGRILNSNVVNIAIEPRNPEDQ